MSSRKRHCFDVGSIAYNVDALAFVADAQKLNRITND